MPVKWCGLGLVVQSQVAPSEPDQENAYQAQGIYCRRQTTRLGAPKALTATAHKLARTFYSMLKNGTAYVDKAQDYYEHQYHDRVVNNLKKRALRLGLS